MYNEAEIYYGDMEIKAGIIVIDYSKNEVYAGGIKDSLGEYTQRPVFKQGNKLLNLILFDLITETEKALIFNSRTEQGDITVHC